MMEAKLTDILPQTAAIAEEGIARGLHHGLQVSVSRAGTVIADNGIGTSHDDVPMTADTLVPWISAGKPLTAVCILQLIEQGQVELEAPVVELIPEFHQTSGQITLRELLTHTAGLNQVDEGWPQARWDETIATICTAGQQENWDSSRQGAYDRVQCWFLLGEVCRRVTKQPIDQLVRDRICEPIGMTDTWIAMPADVHREYADRIGRTYNLSRQRQQEETPFHTLAYCQSASPGSSCRGPLRDLRRFYEMLLNGGQTACGEQILKPDTITQMTTRHREGVFDETFQHTIDFGLGVIINSLRYGAETVPYGYGSQSSDETFGHGGARSCIAFADPQRQLVVCLLANGYLSEPQHQRRMKQLLAALEADLSATSNQRTP